MSGSSSKWIILFFIMTQVSCQHSHQTATPVLMYGETAWNRKESSLIASPVLDKIRDLGCPVSPMAFDFLTIAMAVYSCRYFF